MPRATRSPPASTSSCRRSRRSARALVRAVEDGAVDEALVDRALRRVLRQKARARDARPRLVAGAAGARGGRRPRLGRRRARAASISTRPRTATLARRLAEEAVVLLSNDGVLPLRRPAPDRGHRADRGRPVRRARLLLVPVARRACGIPKSPIGIALPTLREALAAEFPGRRDRLRARHHDRRRRDRRIRRGGGRGIRRRRRRARPRRPRRTVRPRHERRRLRRRGPRRCPARSRRLLDAVLATGTPTVVTLLAGRPYALGSAPERGGRDRADVLRRRGGHGRDRRRAERAGQPERTAAGERAARSRARSRRPTSPPTLARRNERVEHRSHPRVRLRPRPRLLAVRVVGCRGLGRSSSRVDGAVTVSIHVGNAGDRDGVEVVQLYLHDPVASASCGRCSGSSPTRACRSRSGSAARVSFEVPGRSRVVHRARRAAHRRARRDRAGLRPLQRRHRAERARCGCRRDPHGRPHRALHAAACARPDRR